MLWRIKNDAFNYRIIVPAGSPYTTREFLDLEPIMGPIVETKLKYKMEDERDLPVPDFLGGPEGVLTFRPVLWTLFKHLRLPRAIIYDGVCGKHPISFFCCLEERSGFDFRRSNFATFPDDGEIERIFDLKTVPGLSSDLDIFRLADSWGCRFELIATDNFRNICLENKLTGLKFTPTDCESTSPPASNKLLH